MTGQLTGIEIRQEPAPAPLLETSGRRYLVFTMAESPLVQVTPELWKLEIEVRAPKPASRRSPVGAIYTDVPAPCKSNARNESYMAELFDKQSVWPNLIYFKITLLFTKH